MDADDGLPVLDPVEQRVIGALLEKELTVPASYPMTLNGLRTACNQASSRDPVVDYDEATIVAAIDRLKPRRLARVVHASHGARTVKYRQVLDELLALTGPERAVLTVLLLRGPQASGELKARTERLHRFDDRSEVEAVIGAMADRAIPLVERLERRAGQHDHRWAHRLGPAPDPVDAPAGRPGPTVDRDQVLADGPAARDAKVVAAYDALAPAYADAYQDELDAKPFDRWLLERVATMAEGPVVDAGCGPGHVAFHLAAAGAEVTALDRSPGMVAEARRRYPELLVLEGDLTDLPAPPGGDPGWGAVVAWYSLVHLAGRELPPAVALLARTLRPGGWLAVAVHVGDEVRHVDELLGQPIDLDFVLHDAEAVLEALRTAGLVELEWYRRGPIGAEVATERLYALARRP